MRVEVILQHGWGFDSRIWSGWIPHLSAICDTTIIHAGERGYYGASAFDPEFIDSKSFKIVIAHSLGLHFLSPESLAQTNAFYLLSSFLSFHPEDQLSNKRSKRLLRAMREKLSITPYMVLRDFIRLCYATEHDARDTGKTIPMITIPTDEPLDKGRLMEDLDLLDHCDLLGGIDKINEKALLCLFHGTADRVVSPDKAIELGTILPRAKLMLVENGSHALPTTHGAVCIETLKDSLFSLLETFTSAQASMRCI
jgi:pimeloyl-[acyl-carrier protein] methyl ester esterase